MNESLVEGKGALESLVGQVADEFLRRQEQGERPDVEEYAARHPEAAPVLRKVLTALGLLEQSLAEAVDPAGPAPQGPAAGTLGDFRILREVGRGGMGVVYEAQQISLGRRVALKVLPFAAAMDARQLQRFQNEAQAAAHLHHQNIVPVFYVGCERGIHFYAMQFIEGQTLAGVIRELRQLEGLEPPEPTTSAARAGSVAGDLLSGQGAPAKSLPSPLPPTGLYAPPRSDSMPLADTAPVAAFSTARSARSPAYFRSVATLGVQTAQALEHAHQLGVIHRDIKPGNLLLELTSPLAPVAERGGSEGLRLWIADFGLARLGSDAGLTMTGDLLGTIRYMSPEQALAKRVPVDHRTDIYSLGTTLYELLTLEPAYNGRNREEVLRQIAFEDPRPPRRVNKRVPLELETIVLKAMGKNPEERYASAQELADDLGRFLEDKPIKAKRPSLRQRTAKWARRHRTVVRAGFVVLALAVVVLAASTWFIFQAKNELQTTLDRERLNLYYQRIARAEREWSANDLGRMLQLLEACPPDLRGWEWHYLRRLPYRTVPPLRHDSAVHGAAFSPDGRRIASSDHNGVVKIWDVQTGRELNQFQAHDRPTNSVAFSPDRLYLATADDRCIKIWDAETGQPIRTLSQPSGPSSVAFSPDGRRLASGSNDRFGGKEVKIWDVATGQELLTLEGHTGAVRDVAFSPDGRRLASASTDRTIKLSDSETGQELRTFRGHTLALWSLAFSPDGKRLASVASATLKKGKGEIKVWDVQTGQELLAFQGHASLVLGVAFSPDGRRLATGGQDRTVKLWDAATGQEILTFRGHRNNWVRPVAFSPDGTKLLSACTDRTVRIWNATPLGEETGEEVLTLRAHREGVRSVVFDPEGRYLVTAGNDNVVKIWDARSGRELHSLDAHSGMFVNLAFSHRGKYLALSGERLRVWDTTTWKEVLTVPTESNAVAFGPAEQLLASGAPNSTVKVREVATGRELHTLRDHNWGIAAVAFSPDGRTLASASADSSVRLWDLKTGEEVTTPLMRHVGCVSWVAFSPDGLQLASAGIDQTVKVWDTSTWRERRAFHDPTGGVQSLAWRPDGKRLAWGGTDSTVKLGDLETGTILRTLRGHTGWIEAVAYSPDGHWIASASLDGTVKIWPAVCSEEPDLKAEDPGK